MMLMVDRYSAYKAMTQVKLGLILLAFCWSHVRRDFIEAYVKDKSCGRKYSPTVCGRMRTGGAVGGLTRHGTRLFQGAVNDPSG